MATESTAIPKMCSLSKRSTSGIVHTIAMSCRTPDRPGVPQRPGSTGADDIATESTAFPKAHRIDRVCPNGPGQPGPTTLQRRARRFHIALSVLLLLLLLLLYSFFHFCAKATSCAHVYNARLNALAMSPQRPGSTGADDLAIPLTRMHWHTGSTGCAPTARVNRGLFIVKISHAHI